MSILAPATQPSQADSSVVSDLLADSSDLVFPSHEEIELELADEASVSTSKRKHLDAFPAEVKFEKKYKRSSTWNRVDSLEETENLVAVTDRSYEYDPELRPYHAVVYNDRYHISVDRGRESNRVFRTIPANRFLILVLPPLSSYREAYRLLNTDITYTFPDTGIVKKWTFLGSSDSRIRSRAKKSVIFFEEGPDYSAREVLQHFGDLDSVLIKSGMGKYFARLGLNFSTISTTITVEKHQVAIIPDIPAADGKEFTDGCGCITASAAREVAHQLGLSYVPSVLQFRFAGAKGVIVPHENEDLEKWFPGHYDPDIILYLRPSQIKYDAWHYLTLDISDYSKKRQTFRCAKLQKAMIKILTDLGVPLRNFKILLHKELERLTCVMDDRQKASDWLQLKEASLDAADTSPQGICLRMIAAGHELTEPRLCEMVGRLLAADVAQLRRKFNITVAGSIYLFGVCDESGQLAEDEIYCHAGVEGFIEGEVLLTRSPMMHPGDIRLVTAVKPNDDSPYRLHRDLVVLPIRGYQPLADKMGGGDLDGDMYFVSWNELIIPPSVDPPNPRLSATATHLQSNGILKKKNPADHMDDIRRYVARRLNNYDIGETAKKWDETSNSRALGSRDPYCLALAHRYECCLDTNKTGEDIPPFPDKIILGPILTGSPPTKELDDIIVQQTQNLSFPWTFGQGDRTSFQQKQRFVFDPDLLFLETSPEWKKIYAQMIRLNTEYWSEFHKTIREVEGPNRPLVRVAKSNDVGGNYEKTKDLVREAAFQRLEEYAQQLKLQVFPKSRRSAEFNKENTIAASACLALVYNRMAIGLATPIEFGWWGEPWLNSLKAQRVNEKLEAFGPPVCVAQVSKREHFRMELRVKDIRRAKRQTIPADLDKGDKKRNTGDTEPLFMGSDSEAD